MNLYCKILDYEFILDIFNFVTYNISESRSNSINAIATEKSKRQLTLFFRNLDI